jgi:hypothetical protein
MDHPAVGEGNPENIVIPQVLKKSLRVANGAENGQRFRHAGEGRNPG